jgi:Flp pilus assembly protein TadB
MIMARIYAWLAAAGAILVAIGAIYTKGRSDASNASKLQSYKDTQDAIEKASRARNAVERAPVERLRDNDGFRRD